MALTVESPGIISAKEEAAAILYARQPQTSTIKPVVQEEQEIIQVAKPTRPTFAKYHSPEPTPVVNKSVEKVTFRPYKTFDEVKTDFQPQVIRPYIDSSEYLSSAVATTTVEAEAPAVEEVVETAPTTVVKSALDTELEEDTQYVVKFKQSTIVAATIIASIFVLLTVLCIVNIVSLVTTSAQVGELMQQSTALHETLNEERANLENVRQEVVGRASDSGYKVDYQPSQDIYTATASTTTNSSFFDWLCHSLSSLFS